jgi:glutamyl-tRNA reductase
MRAGEARAGHHPTTFRFTSATFAHPEVNADARAGLALDGPALESALERVRDAGIDAFVMNTCLRVEVAASGCERALGRVLELLFPDQELPAARVVRFDQEAVHHLYRVAAGLDSPIVGEPEVLGQFRAALDASRSSGVVGGLFEKALQSAIANGKALRRRMPHVGTGSVAVAAADIAVGAERVAIFGAGAMARAAAEALQRKPDAPEITVYARRPDAVSFPVDHVRDIGEAPRALAEMPVVISATAAKHELFGSAVLAASLGRRNDELLLIDLAMPPDFRPDDSTGHLCYLCVDDVAARARAVSAASSVELAAEQAAGEAWAKLSNHHLVGPVIAAILAEADRAVSEEVSRFAGRLNGETDVLQQLAQTVAHRVLHRPLSFLGSSEHGADAAPVLAEVFGVDGDD